MLFINDIINFEASRGRTKDDDRMYVRVSETPKTDDMNHPLKEKCKSAFFEYCEINANIFDTFSGVLCRAVHGCVPANFR